MCNTSPLQVSPRSSLGTASNNSSVLNTDLQHAIMTHINVNVTSSFILLFGVFLLFIIIFVVNKVHRNHIMDLHGKFDTVKNVTKSGSRALNMESQV